jgi:signal transduction histidine kinase
VKRFLKRFWPKSLAGQMIALMVLTLFGAQIIGFAIFSDERRLALRSVMREQVLTRTASVVRLLRDTPPALHQNVVDSASTRRLRFELARESSLAPAKRSATEEILFARLSGLLGKEKGDLRLKVLDDNGFPFWRPRRRWRGFDDDDDDNDDGHHRERRHMGPFGGGEHGPRVPPMGLRISVSLPGDNWLNVATLVPARDPAWRFPTHFSLIATALVLALILVFMVRRVTRPMARLAAAADRLGRGEALDPVPEKGPADVLAAITAFNRMSERLERFVRDRTHLVAAISHDLRTPITSLRLRAEMIEDRETRDKIIETLEEMQALAEATLAFAKEEATPEDTRTVDLAALLDSLCQDFADMGRDASLAEGPRIALACRPLGLRRAFRNLIENAMTYGGTARVSLARDGTEIAIRIDDDGPGIPEERMEQVFEPFHRLEESRSRETGGIGLGLAIARSIVRGHGGDIRLANREGGGLRVTVRLPGSGDGS